MNLVPLIKQVPGDREKVQGKFTATRSLSEYVNNHRRTIDLMLEVERREALTLARYPETNKLGFRFDAEGCSDGAKTALAVWLQSSADQIEAAIMGSVLLNGPKIFRPSHRELEALEQMSVNLDISDYTQPFPSMVLELPANYCEQRRVSCPQEGKWIYAAGLQPPTHVPTMIGLRHYPELGALLTVVMLNTGVSIKTIHSPPTGHTLEETLVNMSVRDTFVGSLETTGEEWDMTMSVLRAAMNYCLLVEEVGRREVGPANPSHRRRLEHFLDTAKKRKSGVERARTDLLLHPTVYTLDRQVVLAKYVSNHRELPGEELGARGAMPPHHRRGHWRMQACGVGFTDRKRIRIAPVFVNAHLFSGDLSQTRTTYETDLAR